MAQANELIGVFERVFKVKVPVDAKQGVEIPLTGVVVGPILPTPLVIGSADPGAAIRITLAPTQIKVLAPVTIAGVSLFRCDASITVSRDDLTIECETKFLVQKAKFRGKVSFDFKRWELRGESTLRVLGHDFGRTTVIINQRGVSFEAPFRFGVVKVDLNGRAKWDLSDWKLAGKAEAKILGHGLGLDIEVDERGVWAEAELFGIDIAVGPVNPQRIWDKIVDAVKELLDPLEIGKKLVKEAIEIGKDAVEAAKEGFHKVKEKAEKYLRKAKEALDWAKDKAKSLVKVAEKILKKAEEFARWAVKRLEDLAKFLKDIGCAVGGAVTGVFCGFMGCDDPCDDDDKEKADDEKREVKHKRDKLNAEAKAKKRAAKEAKEEADDRERDVARAKAEVRAAANATWKVDMARARVIEAEHTKAVLHQLETHGLKSILDCTAKRGAIWRIAIDEAEDVAKKSKGPKPSRWLIESHARHNCHQYWAAIPKGLRTSWEKAAELKVVKRAGFASLRKCAEKRPDLKRRGDDKPSARELMARERLYGHEYYTVPEMAVMPGWYAPPTEKLKPQSSDITKRCETALERLPAAVLHAESYVEHQPKVVDLDEDAMMRASFVESMAARGLKRLLRKRAKDERRGVVPKR
ncbi:MAG: hypothetical protein HYY84_17155 [Deltaproteobacteria bacterium]|nr:hypothetical protein [Deltaproteobacteria bacterium]